MMSLMGLSVEQLKAYRNGFHKALWDYAVQRDGVYYVGCGVKTYRQAADQFSKEIGSLIEEAEATIRRGIESLKAEATN